MLKVGDQETDEQRLRQFLNNYQGDELARVRRH
jgi:hypothetical protein